MLINASAKLVQMWSMPLASKIIKYLFLISQKRKNMENIEH